MNLNAARRLRRCVSGFSIAGWRTWRESNPLINRYSIFTTKWRDFSRIMSFDSFPDCLLGNQAQGWTNTLSLTRSQRFRRSRSATVLSSVSSSALEADLSTTATSVARIPEGPLPGPIAARARLRASVPHVGTFHTRQGLHPLPAAVAAIERN